VLELLDNRVTELGCEFIASALHPRMDPSLTILKLDHNDFGPRGMINLSEGIAVNPTLKMLSLQYCGITEEAAQSIFEILIYTRSALEDLNLNGNNLGNEGVKTVLTGTSIAKSLKKLHIADN
jgi:Ran GTPase-activating protein (RanGAP) involved in mRNA processing and transport